MSYKCKLYSNTGFNDTNIPDSPALLGTGVEVPALDIWQDRNLSEIRVKARWDDVKDVDYISLENSDGNVWYYYTGGATMTATDVAVFPVIQDYILSIGGVANLNIIDGITERVHVSNDTFGMYAEADPLTVPTRPMKVKTQWFNEEDTSVSGGITGFTYIDAIFNIELNQNGPIAQTYTDTAETGDTVTTIIPRAALPSDFLYNDSAQRTFEGGQKTFFSIENNNVFTGFVNTNSIVMKSDNRTRNAITTLRSLGVENPVLNQVCIPNGYLAKNVSEEDIPLIRKKGDEIVERITISYYPYLTGIDEVITPSEDKQIPYIWDYKGGGKISNNRVFYGEYPVYGLLTAAGESCEYNAEDLATFSGPNDDLTLDTAPKLWVRTDPRLTGKPYFRFAAIDSDDSKVGFWRNCVAGMQWKQVPLTYTQPVGTALNTLRYKNSKKVSAEAYETRKTQRLAENVKGISSIIGGGVADPIIGMTAALKEVPNLVNNAIAEYVDNTNTEAQRTNELAELAIANSAIVPEVQFPYNADAIRDFYGNGVLMYRFQYSDIDAHRIDTLLTAYGYKCTKQLKLSDFTNRKLFNFVKCSSVSIGGGGKPEGSLTIHKKYPRWINKGIEDQLKNGVRVWHTSPQCGNFGAIARAGSNEIV